MNANLIRKYIFPALLILWIFIIPGCGKNPINGELDGQWQVMEVTPTPPDTIAQGRLYYCFYLHVCQLTSYGSGAQTAGNLNYDSKGKTISLNFPDITSERGLAILKQYGIYSNPVTFDIELLSGNSLILRDGDVHIILRKF